MESQVFEHEMMHDLACLQQDQLDWESIVRVKNQKMAKEVIEECMCSGLDLEEAFKVTPTTAMPTALASCLLNQCTRPDNQHISFRCGLRQAH